MVNAVNPTYYAEGMPVSQCELVGLNFSYLPADAVGIRSTSNESPLYYRDTTQDTLIFDLNVVDDEHINAVLRTTAYPSVPSYFSAIVSEGGERVYWVNESRPIPV